MLDSEFKPMFTPYEMLELGIFDGKYYRADNPDFNRRPTITTKNLFKEGASQSRKHWEEQGWITPEDPMGWFQWYCRFTNGRRIPKMDVIQIKRWKNFRRHVLAIEKNCEKGDLGCRRRQRQAILQWAYDPYR
mgnify:CR=1 FL=1